MSKNNTKSAQRKAAKKKNRAKAIRKNTNISRNNISVNKRLTTKSLFNDKEKADFSNQDILRAISDTISIIAPVHAGIEIREILVKEGKLEPLTEEENEMVDFYDNAFVKYSEDARAVQQFIEMGKEPEEYFDILISLMNNTTDLVEVGTPAFMDEGKPLERDKKVIDDYVTEHKTEGESFLDYSFRINDVRMRRIWDKYKTVAIVEQDPDFQEIVQELNEDIEDAEFEEMEPFKVQEAEDATPLLT